MLEAVLNLDLRQRIGRVSDGLFGALVEHLGRCVYTGIYEPGHPAADAQGLRGDVLDLVRRLGISTVRYPGGNFVSGYDWLDGIGPTKLRPPRLELAWQSVESNRFGTDEFMAWCQKADIAPMMAVNLGSGTPQQAAALVEYCNHPGGGYYGDLRRENGHAQPYGVKTWCLGNEMDGPWQICGTSSSEYANKALMAAKMMRLADPSIRLVACGSSSNEMPTFPEWDRAMLDILYEQVDAISLHRYYFRGDRLEDFFASSYDMGNYIRDVKITADYVRAKHRSAKTLKLSFDEWNVWDMDNEGNGGWQEAPALLEETYDLADTLVFAGMMNTLLNNCDRVDMACMAQLVNVIAPMTTKPGGGILLQGTYSVFEAVSALGRGEALKPLLECARFESKYGEAPFLSVAAIYHAAQQEITLFITNYSDTDTDCHIAISEAFRPLSHRALTGKSLDIRNTWDAPNALFLAERDLPVSVGIHSNKRIAQLPAYSFNIVRLGKGESV